MLKSILPAWIPVHSTGQRQRSKRRPGFASFPCKGSKANTKSGYHRQLKNGLIKSHNHSTLLKNSSYMEDKGKVITSTTPSSSLILVEIASPNLLGFLQHCVVDLPHFRFVGVTCRVFSADYVIKKFVSVACFCLSLDCYYSYTTSCIAN